MSLLPEYTKCIPPIVTNMITTYPNIAYVNILKNPNFAHKTINHIISDNKGKNIVNIPKKIPPIENTIKIVNK